MSRVRPQAQAGFTLVEVLAAALVLSVLIIGLGGLWNVAGGSVGDLAARQRAIMVLNGQMARLSSLYQYTDYAETSTADTTGYDGGPEPRLIYRTDLSNELLGPKPQGFVETEAGFSSAPASPILFVDEGGLSADRNYVWIDKARNIVGRLSWTEADIVVNRCNASNEYALLGLLPCTCTDWSGNTASGGDRCRFLTLYLDYPFHWNGSAVVAAPVSARTISLQTIVGRWR